MRDALDVQVMEAADAARAVIALPTWTCSDGHEHPRPADFTKSRLRAEVDGRYVEKRWTGSVIGLGIHMLIDSGELACDTRWRLTVVPPPTDPQRRSRPNPEAGPDA